jgi:hypothetical protein
MFTGLARNLLKMLAEDQTMDNAMTVDGHDQMWGISRAIERIFQRVKLTTCRHHQCTLCDPTDVAQ